MQKTLIAIFCLIVSGCSHAPASRPAVASISTPSATVNQTGHAETPAKVETAKETARIPIPAGSVLRVRSGNIPKFADMPQPVEITLAESTELEIQTTAETITAPTSYEPPAPPTPADLSDGRAVWFYRLALFGGLAAGLFGLVRDYNLVMWGGASVAAAAAFGLFAQRHPVLLAIMGAGSAAALAGFLLWHFHVKKLSANAA